MVIKTNGKIISPNQWFGEGRDFYNGFAQVKKKILSKRQYFFYVVV